MRVKMMGFVNPTTVWSSTGEPFVYIYSLVSVSNCGQKSQNYDQILTVALIILEVLKAVVQII